MEKRSRSGQAQQLQTRGSTKQDLSRSGQSHFLGRELPLNPSEIAHDLKYLVANLRYAPQQNSKSLRPFDPKDAENGIILARGFCFQHDDKKPSVIYYSPQSLQNAHSLSKFLYLTNLLARPP